MKLSENTLSVLKNFASINSGLILHEGNKQKTICPQKAILVEATIEDDFPGEIGIYDLNRFLGNVSALKNPDLEFGDNRVTMSNDDIELTYFGCQPNLIISPPEKELALKSVDVKFSLSNAAFQQLLKLAAMNSLSNLTVVGEDGELLLKVHDKSVDTSNYATFNIGVYTGTDFTATFKTDNLKLLPDDYDVEIQFDAFAKFVNKTNTLKYFIALEKK